MNAGTPEHTSGSSTASPSWSLTLRLTVANAASAFLLMALIALLLYGGLAAQLRKQNHVFLNDQLKTMEHLIRLERSVAAVKEEADSDSFGEAYVEHYVRLMDREQHVLFQTPGMERMVPAAALPVPDGGGYPAKDHTWRTANGKTVISTLTWIPLQSAPGGRAILQVAMDVTNVETILVGYRAKIYLVLSLGLLLCVAVSFAIARKGTQPVREITEIVRRITVTNLEERISGKGWPSELNTLAQSMNLMLYRLEDSFARLYQSATNLSHKMRTPLTILRGEAEVALSGQRSVEELQDVIASSLEEVGRLTRLGDNILFLANADMGKFQTEPVLVDCREEADLVVEYYLPFAEDRGITVTCEGEASVVADRALLRKSLSALVSNAVTYNSRGGRVEVTLRQEEGTSCSISVTDTGCGVPAQEMRKIFDRFYRIYATRYMDPHGTGLGLPIASAIMELHRGTVTVQSEPGEGTTATLHFPAAENAPLAAVQDRAAEGAGNRDSLPREPVAGDCRR